MGRLGELIGLTREVFEEGSGLDWVRIADAAGRLGKDTNLNRAISKKRADAVLDTVAQRLVRWPGFIQHLDPVAADHIQRAVESMRASAKKATKRTESVDMAESGQKIGKSKVQSALNKSRWTMDRLDKSLFRRMADVLPGVVVHEFKKADLVKGVSKPGGPSTYRVVAYQGQDQSPRWKNSGDLDSLDKVLVHVNTWASGAREAWETEGGG